jgi:O-antigen/teichoic acid export membrane protein
MEDVGIFNVANRLASLLLFPLMAMISILSPKFAALHRQGAKDELAALARRSSICLMVIVMPAAGVVAFTAEWVLGMFGPEFVAGALVLRLLLIGVVVNAATGAVAELLMMTGYVGTAMRINAVGALIIFVGSWLLIPQYGGVGAAIAVTTGYAILNILMTLMVRRKLGFNPVGLK